MVQSLPKSPPYKLMKLWEDIQSCAITDRYGEKGICQLSSCVLNTRYVSMLKQGNHIWYNSFSWRYHLIQLTVIYHYSLRPICLLHRTNVRIKWSCDGDHHSCIFQSNTTLCNPSRNVTLFLIYYFTS